MGGDKVRRHLYPLGLTGVGVCLVLGLTVGATPSVSADVEDQTKRFAESFGECLQAQRRADVLLLMDQSQSLKSTDEDALREAAAKGLVQDFAAIAASEDVEINLSVDSFKEDYVSGGGTWNRLRDQADTEQSLSQIDAVIPPIGFATEYWEALTGAQRQLSGREGSCQLTVWFTDGKFDLGGDAEGWVSERPYAPGQAVTSGTEDAIIDKGMKALCAKSGPVSALRAGGGYQATVLLRDAGNAGASQEAERMVRQITEDDQCGSKAKDADHNVVVAVADAPTLSRGLALLSGGQDLQAPLNKDGRAVQGFELDDSVGSVTVLADADNVTKSDADFKIGLLGPLDDGKKAQPAWFDDEGDGSLTVSGGKVKVDYNAPSDRVVRFSMRRPEDPSAWSGQWQVVFEAQAKVASADPARTILKVYGDNRAAWQNPPDDQEVSADEEQILNLGFVKGGESEKAPSGGTVSVQYRGRGGNVVDIKSGIPVAEIQQPISWTPSSDMQGPGAVVVTLNATIGKTQLMPARTRAELAIRPPVQLPGVRDAELVFPEASGLEPTTAALTVVGPAQGAGCVWLDEQGLSEDSIQARPDEFTQIAITSEYNSPKTCLSVAQDAEAQLPVTLTPVGADEQGGNGPVIGDLSVETAGSPATEESVVLAVPFKQERLKLADEATRWGVLALALLLGLGLPTVLLFAVRRRFAAIPVSSPIEGDLAAATKQIRVLDSTIQDAETGEPLQLVRGDLRVVSGTAESQVARLDVEGITLRSEPFGNPFALPRAIVSSDVPLVTDTSVAVREDGSATLPLALAGHWVARRGSADTFTVTTFMPLMQANQESLSELSRRWQESLRNAAGLLTSLPGGTAGPVLVGGPDAWGAETGGSYGDPASSGWGSQSPPVASQWGDPNSDPLTDPDRPNPPTSGW